MQHANHTLVVTVQSCNPELGQTIRQLTPGFCPSNQQLCTTNELPVCNVLQLAGDACPQFFAMQGPMWAAAALQLAPLNLK
jgi:hypothetical protein